MFVVGLTGSIASGKTFATTIFQEKGFHVISADDVVSDFYITNDIIKNKIKYKFPKFYNNSVIDKKEIIDAVEKDINIINSLEEIIFPELFNYLSKIINKKKYELIVLEIPILYRSNINLLCDVIIKINVPYHTQLNRIRKRNNYSEVFMLNLINRSEKLDHKADYEIDSGCDQQSYIKKVSECIDKILFNYKKK